MFATRILSKVKLPKVTLFTRTYCPLCDEALEELEHLSGRFELEKVYIDKKGADKWFLKYKHDIPVFHFEGEFLMQHRADVELLEAKLEQFEAMVFFSCALCGEQIKKPKMEKHLSMCRSNKLTCIDCLAEFDRNTYKSHNKCMTENERYGGKDYVEKTSKGEGKQRAWIQMITDVMEKATLSPSAGRIWTQLENGGFENIPRKKTKFVNFIQNSMRTGDKKAIEEIWAVFEQSFNKQRQEGQQQAKKTPKKEPMKFDASRPWYEQLSAGKSGSTKSDSSSSSSSEDEKKKKTPVKVVKKKPSPAKKAKKESSSSSSEEEEVKKPTVTKPVTKKPAVAKKESSSSESSSSEEEEKKVVKKPVKKPIVTKKESSSSASSSEEEDKKKPVVAKPVAKKATPKKVAPKKESSSESSSSEEEEKVAKKPLKKPIVTKKDSSSSESSSEEEEEVKKPVVAKPAAKKEPKKSVPKKESSSDSSSSEEEKVAKKPLKKPIVAKKDSSSSDDSSSEDEKPAKKPVAKKAVVKKPTVAKKESSSSESSSEEEEEVKKQVAKKVAKKPVKKESSSSSDSDDEEEKPVKAPKPATKKLTKKVAKKESSSSDSSSSDEEEVVAKPAKPVVSKKPKKAASSSSDSSSSSSDSDDDEPPKKVAKKSEVKETPKKRPAEVKVEVSAKKAKKEESESSSSSDEEPVKKVPLKQAIKPTPPPKSAENGGIKKKTVTPMEHDYRDERDQRTIFVKNLPFSASVDDLWEVFATENEEDLIDCRFIVDKATGNHKGLAFIEYAAKKTAEEALGETFTVKGRIVNQMRAGLKKGDGNQGPKKQGNSDERDRRTLFVKELPYKATPDQVMELFGAIDARFLKNPDGTPKGISFVEFNTEKEALDVYNNEDGYEMDGRWLVIDTIKPRSEMRAGNNQVEKKPERKSFDQNGGGRKPRHNKWAGLAPSLDKKNGAVAEFGGKKQTFNDSD